MVRYIFCYLTIICSIIVNLDLTMGRLEPRNIPPRYQKEGMNMMKERFRRVLSVHPEFSERLSDFDRSALWRSNYRMVAALSIAKVKHKNKIGEASYEKEIFFRML